MTDFQALGYECLARDDEVEAVRQWMNGLDAGDGRCGEAITRFIRDTCLSGGHWETIAHYLDRDLSKSCGQSFYGKKFVGMKEVPLLEVDWPVFSFAPHKELADLAETPTPIWGAFKDYCSDRGVTTFCLGQYAFGLWPGDRTTALQKAGGGPDSTVPIQIFFSAAADGSGLRIATPLARGSIVGGMSRPSRRWFLEAFFRLGEDESRDRIGMQATTLGEIFGRADLFCPDKGSLVDPDELYQKAGLFPRPVVWTGDANWFFQIQDADHGERLLRRFQTPRPELWTGYLVPMNTDRHHLGVCIGGAIHAVNRLADWYSAASLEAQLLYMASERRNPFLELTAWQIPFAGILSKDVDRGCWPEQLTPIFAGMDRGDAEAFAAWAKFQEMLDHKAERNS